MYNFKILTEVDHIKWNKDLMKSNYATFFQTTDYLISQTKDYFPIFIYVFDENGNVVGQLGLRIIKSVVMYASPLFRRFSRIISNITSRAIWLDGPIIHTNDKKARLEILQNIIKANDVIAEKYDLVHIEGYSPACDLMLDEDYKQELKKNNYTVKDYVTFIIDMTKNIDEIWKNIPKRVRQDVNRAKRRNIIVKEIEDYDDLKEYLLLAQKWAKTKGLEITDPFLDIEKLWNNHRVGIERFFLAYQNNELISGLRIVYFNGIVHPNAVISSYLESTSLGGTLLTWSSLEWAKNAGARIYDFTGGPKEKSQSNEQGEQDREQSNSLLYYKRKWGGNEFSQYNLLKARKKYTYKLYLVLFTIMRHYHNFKMRQYKKTINPKKEAEDNSMI